MPQTHRFRNKVAVSIGTGETVYMTAAEATRFASALFETTYDVTAYSFQNSKIKTFSLEIGDPDNGQSK